MSEILIIVGPTASGKSALAVELAKKLDGEIINDFPFPTKLDKCKPVLTRMPGWKKDISHVRKWEDLPKEARNYVEMIEKAVGCPITYVSVGPERDAYIERK